MTVPSPSSIIHLSQDGTFWGFYTKKDTLLCAAVVSEDKPQNPARPYASWEI